jgi:hypothetical protein
VTCPDGTVLTPAEIEAMPDHHEAAFNATAHCPVKPTVTLIGLPTSIQVFKAGAFTFKMDAGTYTPAHSMLTSIRYNTRPIPDSDLTNVNKYPYELVKKEHQNLPATFDGTATFTTAGKVYVRAYMEQGGNDYWSAEYPIDVKPVTPSGKVVDVTIGTDGTASPDMVQVVLGDAVRIVNNYPVEDKCSRTSGPAATADFDAAGGLPSPTNSDPIVFVVPLVYEYLCNDQPQPHGFKVNVSVN